MDTAKAKKLMEGLVPSYYVDGGDGEVVGMAMSILLSEGYHDFSFEMLDSGGLRLHTGDITVEDRREEPARGETQRHIQLLVRAAVLAVNGGE